MESIVQVIYISRELLLSWLCPMADASTVTLSQMSSSKSKKPTRSSSVFSRIFYFLVPCISPQSTSNTVELDIQQEKLDSNSKPTTDEVLPQDTTSLPLSLPADTHTLVTSSSSRPATPEHVEEVIPTPTVHLLPQDETAGMTSGAVQPPGSKGDTPTTEKSQSSPVLPNIDGDESEGTSYTEEDLDEQEDDEDKLIFNGGAGIPTGPVSSSNF
jgi:carboxy-terminal domain RNA polymerase II polypeptide A small phosphatase